MTPPNPMEAVMWRPTCREVGESHARTTSWPNKRLRHTMLIGGVCRVHGPCVGTLAELPMKITVYRAGGGEVTGSAYLVQTRSGIVATIECADLVLRDSTHHQAADTER